MKNYLTRLNFLRIRAKDLIYLSKDNMNAPICRSWEFVIEFQFVTLDKVIEQFSKTYSSCDPEEYGGLKNNSLNEDINAKRILEELEGKDDRILAVDDKSLNPHNVKSLIRKKVFFREIFCFNFLCFAFNLILTFHIINKIIEIQRYRTLKKQKLTLYRWLLRDKKSFDSSVSKKKNSKFPLKNYKISLSL